MSALSRASLAGAALAALLAGAPAARAALSYPPPADEGGDAVYPAYGGATIFYSAGSHLLNAVGDVYGPVQHDAGTEVTTPASATLTDYDATTGYAPPQGLLQAFSYGGAAQTTDIAPPSPKGVAVVGHSVDVAGNATTIHVIGSPDLYVNAYSDGAGGTITGFPGTCQLSGPYAQGPCSYDPTAATPASQTYQPSLVWGSTGVGYGIGYERGSWDFADGPVAPGSSAQLSIAEDYANNDNISILDLPMVILTPRFATSTPDYRIDGTGTALCDPGSFGNRDIAAAPWRLGGIYCSNLGGLTGPAVVPLATTTPAPGGTTPGGFIDYGKSTGAPNGTTALGPDAYGSGAGGDSTGLEVPPE